jgi:hypothetical protein
MLNITQNQTAQVDPQQEYADTGWEIGADSATHYPCNPGRFLFLGFPLTIGTRYAISYTVSLYGSGYVNVRVGNTDGAVHNALGTYTEEITCTGDTSLSWYSDGYLRINKWRITPIMENQASNHQTIAYNESGKKWSTKYSYEPEMFVRFIDSFFAFKNGQLWKQNVNPVYNNFFGVQYKSQITFYINFNPSMIKNFRNIRVQGSKVWASPNDGDIKIYPTERKPNGMQSRIKPGNFKNYQGDWFADFMRNLLDPRFDTALEALMKGENLQGKVMEITIENAGTTQAILVAVDVKMDPQNYTY